MAYARGLSYLRIYEQPRKFIRFFIEVTRDITTFIFFTGCVLLGGAICFLQFDYNRTLGDWMLGMYNFLYAQYDISEYSTSMYILFVFSMIVLGLILSNMLISIVLDSHEKLQNKNRTLEFKEKLSLTLEALIFTRFLKICRCGRRKEVETEEDDPDAVVTDEEIRKQDEPENKIGYLLYIGEHPEDEDQLEMNKWDGRLAAVKKSLNSSLNPIKKSLSHKPEDGNEQGTLSHIIHGIIDKEMSKTKEALRKTFRKEAGELNREIAEDMHLIMEKLGVQPPKRDSAKKKTVAPLKKRHPTRTNIAPKKKVGTIESFQESTQHQRTRDNLPSEERKQPTMK
mmetsp:Transcript_21688/g.18683  ORF Transcript_21688/g.18683 Transcript_21688/m.18683 type:complete len:340 (-) Transcript_21688:355-1374(-)